MFQGCHIIASGMWNPSKIWQEPIVCTLVATLLTAAAFL